MSSRQSAASSDPASSTPLPRMGSAMKMLVAMGILGGLMGVLAFAGVLVLLATHMDIDVAARDPAPATRPMAEPLPGAPARRLEPVVVTPSPNRKAAPPEVVESLPAPQDRDAAVRDRTRVTLQVRFVELKRDQAERLLGDKPAHGDPIRVHTLARMLLGPAGGEAAATERWTPEGLDAAFAELDRQGVLRVVASPKLVTSHRRPAKAVDPPDSATAGAGPRPATTTVDCLPEVRDDGRVSVELFAERRTPLDIPDAPNAPPDARESVSTSVTLAGGQAVVLGGLRTRSLPAGTVSETVVLVSASIEPPARGDTVRPLSETELRERRNEQCRYLQDAIAREFPKAQIKLSLAAGKLFIHGQAKDGMEMERIVAAVRRRAVDDWAMVDPPGTAPGSPAARAGAESLVVNMLRTPPQSQVLVRLRLVEIAPRAETSPPRGGPDAGADAGSEILDWFDGLTKTNRSVVIDGKLGERIARIAQQGVARVRVLSEPALVTVSGRKGTLTIGDQVSLPGAVPPTATGRGGRDIARGMIDKAAPAENGSYPVGSVFTVLPEVLERDRIRLEVTPEFRKVVEVSQEKEQPRLVLQSRSLMAAAVVQSGQTLVVPGVPAEESADDPARRDAPRPQRFLLVTAEIVPVMESPLAASAPPPVAPLEPSARSVPPPAAPNSPAPPVAVRTIAPPPKPAETAPGAPPGPSKPDRPLASFFRKAQQADYQESVADEDVPPPEADKTERLPPVEAETVPLAQAASQAELVLQVGGKRTVSAGHDVLRATSVDPAVCEAGRSAPREVTIVGKAPGATHVTVWSQDPAERPVSFAVRVVKDLKSLSQNLPGDLRSAVSAGSETHAGPGSGIGSKDEERVRAKVQVLQGVLADLFPAAGVRLHLAADRLTVEGQADSPTVASQIIEVVRAEAGTDGDPAKLQIVDKLRVGATAEHQVALRVKFLALEPAVLGRAADDLKRDRPALAPLAGRLLALTEKGGHAVLDPADCGDVQVGLRQLERLGLLQIVAQPTLSGPPGRPLSYLLAAANGPSPSLPDGRGQTGPADVTFRFLPALVDPQRLRLEIGVDSGPGNERWWERVEQSAAELRPGQTMAAAGPSDPRRGGAKLVVAVTPSLVAVPPSVSAAAPAPGPSPPAPQHKPVSPPGFTVAESTEPPPTGAPQVTVPTRPEPDQPRTSLLPRVLRPSRVR